jgi:hypothetical protein
MEGTLSLAVDTVCWKEYKKLDHYESPSLNFLETEEYSRRNEHLIPLYKFLIIVAFTF